MIFTRGMRDKLSKYVDIQQEITAEISIEGRSVYDFCCFGVDKAEKLSDDRYMIFYNQTSSPQGEIKYKAGYNSAAFTLRLDKLPETIDKLVFTASIDGSGVMGDITRLKFTVSQNGSERIVIDLKGSDFKQEKAVIAAGIYRKTEWRINAIASGFNGGLPVLLKNFGGEEAVSETTAPAPSVNAQTQTAPTPSVRTQTQTAPTPSVNTQAQTVSTPSVRTQTQTALTPSLNTQQTPPVSVVESLHRNLSFETVRADTAQSNIAPQNPIPQSIPTPPSQSIPKLNITPPSQSTSHLNITPPSQNMPQLNITPPSNYMPQQNVISQPQNTPQQNMTAASRYMPQQNVISQPQNIPQQNMTAASRYMPHQNVISQPQYTPQNNTAMQTGNTAALHIGGFTATAMHMNTNPQPSFNTPVQSGGQGVVLRKTEEQLTSEIMGKINLSKDKVNLEKHVVNLSKCVVDLSKKSGVDLGSARAKVVVVLDYSGSMHTLYANGTVQRTINRLVPLGLTFDDNGTIDVFLFSTEYKKLDDLNIMNYESYVNLVAKNSGMNMGGTMYSP
ncbi:MAG: TerD family protein, partial [Clostridia bacterium]|nr:TerD family protein [Clostridia bacterium]